MPITRTLCLSLGTMRGRLGKPWRAGASPSRGRLNGWVAVSVERGAASSVDVGSERVSCVDDRVVGAVWAVDASFSSAFLALAASTAAA